MTKQNWGMNIYHAQIQDFKSAKPTAKKEFSPDKYSNSGAYNLHSRRISESSDQKLRSALETWDGSLRTPLGTNLWEHSKGGSLETHFGDGSSEIPSGFTNDTISFWAFKTNGSDFVVYSGTEHTRMVNVIAV